jgi:hypothetical protein
MVLSHFILIECMSYRYQCGYGLEDHANSNTQSIKHGCLAHFSIKRLYTQPIVEEITFYHQVHTYTNGDLAHGARDLDFVTQMSLYVLRCHILKNYTWTQLGLRYTVKQIYNKYQTIWWALVNVKDSKTKDDFLILQNIIYLDWTHKKGSCCLH